MSLFSRAEQAAGNGSVWESFYPTPRGEWTVVTQSPDGTRTYLAYDVATDRFRKAEPAEDPILCPIGEWMAHGRLVSYRVGLKATVEVRRNGELAYAKGMTRWKFKELQYKLQAASELSRTSADGFPRYAPLLEQQSSKVAVFGALAGSPLSDKLGTAAARGAIRATARSLVSFHEMKAPGGFTHIGSRKADLEYRTMLAARYFPKWSARYEASLARVLRFEDMRNPAGYQAVVHNDLHDGNVILDGEDVGFLDLESMGAGDPCDDVGNLLAHLYLRAIQWGDDPRLAQDKGYEFLAAYRDTGGMLDETRLAMAVATALHRLSCLHLFRRQSRHLSSDLLARSGQWADQATGGRSRKAGH